MYQPSPREGVWVWYSGFFETIIRGRLGSPRARCGRGAERQQQCRDAGTGKLGLTQALVSACLLSWAERWDDAGAADRSQHRQAARLAVPEERGMTIDAAVPRLAVILPLPDLR
jgi:hypothetical protein